MKRFTREQYFSIKSFNPLDICESLAPTTFFRFQILTILHLSFLPLSSFSSSFSHPLHCNKRSLSQVQLTGHIAIIKLIPFYSNKMKFYMKPIYTKSVRPKHKLRIDGNTVPTRRARVVPKCVQRKNKKKGCPPNRATLSVSHHFGGLSQRERSRTYLVDPNCVGARIRHTIS